MTHHVAAHYDVDERLFLPPSRTLGFNSQLTMNDSLLVHSYMTAYDISYPEAMRRIESEVSELKEILQNEGSYDMQDLGTLSINAEGNYEFAPAEAGILSPTLYGLGSLSVRLLSDKAAIQPLKEETQQPADEQTTAEQKALNLIEFSDDDEDGKAVRIKMSWIRNAVAVAAAIVVFFFMATPVVNSNMDSTTMTQLSHHVLYKLIPQDTNMAPAKPVAKSDTMTAVAKKQETESSPKADAPKTEQATATASAPQAPTYTIVLASQVKMSNAELFVEQLQKSGYEASIYVNNNIVRVIYGSFTTQEEAYKKLSDLHKKDGFEEAWVYKKAAV